MQTLGQISLVLCPDDPEMLSCEKPLQSQILCAIRFVRFRRRGDRVVEGARLESACTVLRTVGSNPTLSAIDSAGLTPIQTAVEFEQGVCVFGLQVQKSSNSWPQLSLKT